LILDNRRRQDNRWGIERSLDRPKYGVSNALPALIKATASRVTGIGRRNLDPNVLPQYALR
jgi:hypothetical protein